MPHSFYSNRLTVFLIRVAIGLVAAFLLTRLFFPLAGWTVMVVLGGLLVFFSYAFEYSHRK